MRRLAEAVPDMEDTATEVRLAARAHREAAETLIVGIGALVFITAMAALYLVVVRDS